MSRNITQVIKTSWQIKVNWIKLPNHADQISLNPNSTHVLCSELIQTHDENELSRELIGFFLLPINQAINQ